MYERRNSWFESYINSNNIKAFRDAGRKRMLGPIPTAHARKRAGTLRDRHATLTKSAALYALKRRGKKEDKNEAPTRYDRYAGWDRDGHVAYPFAEYIQINRPFAVFCSAPAGDGRPPFLPFRARFPRRWLVAGFGGRLRRMNYVKCRLSFEYCFSSYSWINHETVNRES